MGTMISIPNGEEVFLPICKSSMGNVRASILPVSESTHSYVRVCQNSLFEEITPATAIVAGVKLSVWAL